MSHKYYTQQEIARVLMKFISETPKKYRDKNGKPLGLKGGALRWGISYQRLSAILACKPSRYPTDVMLKDIGFEVYDGRVFNLKSKRGKNFIPDEWFEKDVSLEEPINLRKMKAKAAKKKTPPKKIKAAVAKKKTVPKKTKAKKVKTLTKKVKNKE